MPDPSALAYLSGDFAEHLSDMPCARNPGECR